MSKIPDPCLDYVHVKQNKGREKRGGDNRKGKAGEIMVTDSEGNPLGLEDPTFESPSGLGDLALGRASLPNVAIVH